MQKELNHLNVCHGSKSLSEVLTMLASTYESQFQKTQPLLQAKAYLKEAIWKQNTYNDDGDFQK
jgi:hypothetical protein